MRRFLSERGQGTVEYVGLILLVSLLMVGMVAAMKGFNGSEGTEIAEVIVAKIKAAVNAITFRSVHTHRRPPRSRFPRGARSKVGGDAIASSRSWPDDGRL